MSGIEITLLVIAGINLLTSFLSPLVVADAYAIQNIKNSSCCGNSVIMKDTSVEPKQEAKKKTQKNVTDWETFNKNVMNKIKEKRKSQIIEEMIDDEILKLRKSETN
jgi:hypothetical protein